MSALSPAEITLLRLWDAHDAIPPRSALATALGVSVHRVKALLQGLVEKGALEADEVGPLGATRNPARPHGHGLTPREQEIMDLADAGELAESIHRQLRVDLGYIRATIRNFAFTSCWDNSAKFERKARVSSVKLAAAIAATGRSFL